MTVMSEQSEANTITALQLRPPDVTREDDEALAGVVDELGGTGTHSLDPSGPPLRGCHEGKTAHCRSV
jgi:hypothetical protein